MTSKILFLKDGSLIKEDIFEYEQIRYEFMVEDVAKAEDALVKEAIPVEIVGDKLRVYSEGSSLNEVFRILRAAQD